MNPESRHSTCKLARSNTRSLAAYLNGNQRSGGVGHLMRNARIRIALAASFVLGMCTTNSANAEMVYENVATANTAYFADSGLSGQKIYDNFSLSPSASTDVNIAVWTGLYRSNNANAIDDFTIEFWNGAGNTPNSLLTSFSVNSVSKTIVGTMFGRDVYEYTAEFSPVSLNASTNYWFSVLNDTNDGWAWSADTSQGQLAYQTTQGGNFFTTQSSMEFSLFSTPEPGSFVLFSACMIPLLRRRRRPQARTPSV